MAAVTSRACGSLCKALVVLSCLIAADAAVAKDGSRAPAAVSVPVIPMPAAVEMRSGSFTVDASTAVTVQGGAEAERVASYFTDLVRRTAEIDLRADGVGQRISFELRSDAPVGEGYFLEVSSEGVVVSARDPQGLFYGAITLWQLVTADARIPAVRITDSPRFAWRGLMLDVARHYMPPEFIKQMIDWMALHKLNTFHWHLADDQGWRLEIKKYPRLTSVGAWRVPAGAAGVDEDGLPRLTGGFYTREEVRDIVQYAAERFITIVPEIEMPGHAQSAIAAYPELGTGDTPVVSHDWGVHNYIFNVEESTFAFLEDVLSEMMELFPGPYIHVAGDEPVMDRWRASARVQERMRELGVVNETELQSYFVERIEKFVASRGRKIIGWDEILEGGLPAGAAVMSWRGAQGAIEAARSGYDVVLSPSPDLYLDYLQSGSANEPPGRPRYVTLEHLYGFEPVPRELSVQEAHHVLGAQVNIWTEHMRTPERIQHNAFPRVAALAEIGWSAPERKGWSTFVSRLPAQFARYEKLGIAHADSAFEPRFSLSRLAEAGKARVELSNQVERGEIRYTLDGSQPTAQAASYQGPFEVDMPVTLSAATFVNDQQVAKTRARELSVSSLLRRTDDELKSCQRSLVLRLEDDAPFEGQRAIFNVDILDPCWIYEQADLSRVKGIVASVGQLPFNFQVGEEVEKIPFHRPDSAEGELEIRLGSCKGERIAVLPLEPAVGRDGVTTLPEVAITPRAGKHDLCLRFTRWNIDPLWAIDAVQLVE